jgi:Golgi apyrase
MRTWQSLALSSADGGKGSRVHIYRWLNSEVAKKAADKDSYESLPRLVTKKKWTKKIKPGTGVEQRH